MSPFTSAQCPLEVANVAPDIAMTAASSHCSSLQQIADDIRGFHLSHPASMLKTSPRFGGIRACRKKTAPGVRAEAS